MNIIEKIQERTRYEYIDLVKLRAARLSGAIQQKPLEHCAAALAIGFLLAVFSRVLIPLLLLLAVAVALVYFIAPEKKIS